MRKCQFSFVRLSFLLLFWRVFISLPRCLFAAAVLLCSATCRPLLLSARLIVEARLRRQRVTTSGDLKPAAVWNALTESERPLSESINDSGRTPVDTPLTTWRWDAHICCWQRCTSPRNQPHVTDALLSITCRLQLGPLKLNRKVGMKLRLIFGSFGPLRCAASSPLLMHDSFSGIYATLSLS